MLEREDLRQVRSTIKDVLREGHLDNLPDLFGREHHKHRGTHDLTFQQLVDSPDYIDNRQFITIVNEDEDGVAFIDLLGTDHQIVVTKNPEDFTLSADSQFHIWSDLEQPYIRVSNLSATELDPALQFALGVDDTVQFTIGVDDSDSNKLKIANQAALGAAFSSGLQYGDVLYYNHFTGNLVAGVQLSDFATDAVYITGGAGSGDGEFSNARQVALDGTYIYIADDGNDRIQKFLASDGSFVSKTAVGVVTRPWGIVWWGGYLYVSCYAGALSDTIVKIDAETLAPLASFGEYGTGVTQFISPRSMTTDGTDLYICDWGNDRIKKHSFAGAYLGEVGEAGSGNGQFSGPCGIETDGTSFVVCDYGNQRIQKFLCSGLSFVSAVSVQTRDGNKGFPESITLNGINFYVGCANISPHRGYIEKYVIATNAFVAFYDPTAAVGIDVDHVWGSFILKQAILAGDLIVLHQDGSYLEIYPKAKFMDDVRFYEDADPDGNYVGLRAPAAVTADYTLTLPAAAPATQGHLYGATSAILAWGQDVNSAASPTFVRLTLSQAIGTAPMTITSTTVVANLNADQVDGKHEAEFVLIDGTRALTANWDAGAFGIRALTLESDVAAGTAPLTIASTTLVTNLNADLLDGLHYASFPQLVISATASPTVTDDIDNYREGCLWIEQDANTVWFCADNANGAAVWHGIDQGLRTTDSPTFVDIKLSGVLKVDNVQVVKEQQAAIADPSGGTVIDAECRAQLALALAMLRTHGLILT